MELQKIGGWVNREIVDAYEVYARTCFEFVPGPCEKIVYT
jgi:6-phospho-beta-glucosidase